MSTPVVPRTYVFRDSVNVEQILRGREDIRTILTRIATGPRDAAAVGARFEEQRQALEAAFASAGFNFSAQQRQQFFAALRQNAIEQTAPGMWGTGFITNLRPDQVPSRVLTAAFAAANIRPDTTSNIVTTPRRDGGRVEETMGADNRPTGRRVYDSIAV